ncbi:MAG TPA: ImmA/IrrE family metallo-endopeptidase [Candidatus Limnocylindria bacterium]|nr:ImmA/IrrE family metallo-endopeptidase [Candidatus Limnocylindria bacterium]
MALRDAVERLAWEVLARSDVTRPPVDIDAIAAREGLRFVPATFDSILGVYCGDPPSHVKLPFAMIASHQHPLRQRFTKAHELGHHLMDEPRGWVARMRLPSGLEHRSRDYHEWHECFAASLLMPRRWVDQFDGGSWRRDDIARLARRFAVTKIAAATRLEELYGRPRLDIVSAIVPAGEHTGLYAQA